MTDLNWTEEQWHSRLKINDGLKDAGIYRFYLVSLSEYTLRIFCIPGTVPMQVKCNKWHCAKSGNCQWHKNTCLEKVGFPALIVFIDCPYYPLFIIIHKQKSSSQSLLGLFQFCLTQFIGGNELHMFSKVVPELLLFLLIFSILRFGGLCLWSTNACFSWL